MASSASPMVMAYAWSFQLPSFVSRKYYTHSSVSTNNSKFKQKLSMFTLRYPIVETSRFSSSQNTPTFSFNFNRRVVVARSNLKFPLVSPDDQWGIWTALFATGSFGLWSERTKIGRMISAALVSILLGLAASNLGIIPHEARAYSVVMEFLLPLTIPLMLFRADMRNVIKSTGKLLLAFLVGSVATTVGTLVAFLIVPMRSLGEDSWKIASALMASYIGGAINYVAVSDALGVSPSVVAAGVAADNVICALYFMVLFALGSKLPTEALVSTKDPANSSDSGSGDIVSVLQTATALAVSFAICKGGTHFVQLLRFQGGTLPTVTAIVVVLATLLPRQIGYLAPAGDAIAAITIQVFFAVLGASGSIWNVINVAPCIFGFAFIQVTVHLIVILGLGKILNLDLKQLLLASNANIGGPTTASGMAVAKGWGSLIVPGILVGIFGISIATYLAYFFGIFVLKSM
ncbi:uncharacterized protein LOC112514927 isoform X1 [Cynara cardunculus var. scolymus]|uniref:uncharacterized protein LOC112514927 isoform X1 n=2 Tax=Cynara cardunculus var. scolymus TaxID=59895 RepID=UPI000D629B8D|nr:uncharacterized protein LOC112514927 isoform X1 [Cynara cardunculus var. scolymus]